MDEPKLFNLPMKIFMALFAVVWIYIVLFSGTNTCGLMMPVECEQYKYYKRMNGETVK